MKNKIIILLLFVVTSVMADDQKYIQSMAKNIKILYSAKTPEQYQQAINTFDRIGNAEKTKWEPFYYSAFGYLMVANIETDIAKKDQWLDLAAAAVTKAKENSPNESEIIALDGFTQMLRITVDPASRGAKYTGQAMSLYGKAIQLNPENPRALALMAQMQLGAAKFMKTSTTEGCATAANALEKFQTYHPANPIAPMWGKEMTDGLVASCK
ncbi:MAG: hypothetical protein ABIS36_16370 [Chryseolinea sp.]